MGKAGIPGDVDAKGEAKGWLEKNARLVNQAHFKDVQVLEYQKGGR